MNTIKIEGSKMAGSDTIGVFNNTQRIVALKGQVPNKDRKARAEAKRFCNRLEPGILSFVPKAFWAIYKRNNVVQIMLDEEKLMVGKTPVIPKENKKGKPRPEMQQDAALAELEEGGEEE